MCFGNDHKVCLDIRTGFSHRDQAFQVGINLRLWRGCTLYFDYEFRAEVSIAISRFDLFINDQVGSRSFRKD
ncbi:hypothetical protein B0G57_101252 [Trinickia symbiotica]|uniref:Uncharacterized protein n=1 Tax=Trinickia symbiotica TaxID=863227 RepID=A0A2N7X918_9BURK|nr:hypothetical protein C0Z20_04420 [Trinickia symbiotica]PPK47287.1 hypothetical protein B0G57_101252 [Trinickia symbiotica]